MKKLLFILIILMCSSVFAQRNINLSSATPDTLSGADTVLYASGLAIEKFSGVAGFQVYFTNDSISVIKVQGSANNSEWVDISTNDKAEGTYWLVDATPELWYYRLWVETAADDTAYVQKVNFIYKED